MNKIGFCAGVLLLASSILSCDSEHDNPCTKLVNGVYQYPELPDNHNFSREQIHEYRDIPQNIRNCIPTAGLIESCLTYPEITLMHAGVTLQKGYEMVSSQFSGLGELESRPDACDQLLIKYEAYDPLRFPSGGELIEQGRYSLTLSNLEIILSQYIHLNKLTKQQKKALVSRARKVYQLKMEKIENYAVFGLASTSAVLGRLMKLDNYSPFMEVYKPKLRQWDVIENYWPTNLETTETIYAISEGYLNSLN